MRPQTGFVKKGGRKASTSAQPGLLDAVEEAVAGHTAGSPVAPGIRWTNRSPREIAEELQAEGYEVCAETMRRILREELHLGLRQAVKDEARSHYEFRDEQFRYIAEQRAWYERRRWPVLSIDTKQKELLGNFFRDGRAYTDGKVHVLDHDFAPPGQRRLVPYGVYDVVRNEGLMLLGLGADTSELACDAIEEWWHRLGRRYYWHASGLLLLCDCGGGNGNRRYVFKEELSDLARWLRRPIQVAHYPPGCSKYNPIEHRMFCHVTRALQGVVLKTIEIARDFISRAKTTTGLKVIAELANTTYEAGQQASHEFLENMNIDFDDFLPDLNYTVPAY